MRTRDSKYAVYYDPHSRKLSEYELDDLPTDPLEVENLLEVSSGLPRTPLAGARRLELADLLDAEVERSGAGSERSGVLVA